MRSSALTRSLLLRRQRLVVVASATPPPPSSGQGGQKPPRGATPRPAPRASTPPAAAASHRSRQSAHLPFWRAASSQPAAAAAVAAAAAASAVPTPDAVPDDVKPGAPPPLKLKCAVHYLPHREKQATGGEDASFVGADGLSCGVADGVGGWAEVGIDAGVYARLLMSTACRAASQLPEPSDGEEAGAAPLTVLVAAHGATQVAGSSTALVLTLRRATLQAANLGDSGFMLLRAGQLLYRTQPQQTGWNAPRQLGVGRSGDRPTSADLVALPVQSGDVVVAATDGLWDNLFDAEILSVVAAELAAGRGVEGAAKALAEAATVRGRMATADTPFARTARAARVPFRGGKEDDVTVLCAMVEAVA